MRAAICIALLLLGSCSSANRPAENVAQRVKVETEQIGGSNYYTFVREAHFFLEPDGSTIKNYENLIVLYLDEEIWRIRGSNWSGLRDWDGPITEPATGRDITGDGIPDAILMNEEEGSHGPIIYYIFHMGLGDPLRVTVLDGGDCGIAFKDLDGDGVFELKTCDMAFMSWHGGPGYSARPHVTLRYQNGIYVYDTVRMRQPMPPATLMSQGVARIQKDEAWQQEAPYDIPQFLIKVLTDMAYSGNIAGAHQFLDLAWPANRSGKDAFAAELFECRLRKSQYWPAIAAMNGLPADKPVGECPGTEEG